MTTQQKLLGSIVLLLFSLAILGLCVAPSSASSTSRNAWNVTAMHGHNYGHHFAFNSTQQTAMTQAFLTKLQSQGVDTSSVQTALANNDTATVKAWFQTYMASHKGSGFTGTRGQRGSRFSGNATAQQTHLQSMITKLQSQGVDTSSVQTALANNDTATVRSWFATYFKDHPGFTSATVRQPWHRWNATAVQQN